MQLNMGRVEMPLEPVLNLLSQPWVLVTSKVVQRYLAVLRSRLAKNEARILVPVGFCLAIYNALHSMSRPQEAEVIAFFPVLLNKISELGGDAPAFVTEVRKCTDQYITSNIKRMR